MLLNWLIGEPEEINAHKYIQHNDTSVKRAEFAFSRLYYKSQILLQCNPLMQDDREVLRDSCFLSVYYSYFTFAWTSMNRVKGQTIIIIRVACND